MKNEIELTNKEFSLFQKIIFKELGIFLENSKKFLLKNKLLKQLLIYNLNSYSDYYRLIQVNKNEKIKMLNIITTNETYFFREKKHFDFLEKMIIPYVDKLRVWSAASSTGVEAYSIAMLLDNANIKYEIIGSDVNTEVIKKANIGLYPVKMMSNIPDYLKVKYCLKGKGNYEGLFLVDRILITKMDFQNRNLLDSHTNLGLFNIIFLRNVLIYFSDEMKEKILKNIMQNLEVGGYLILSLTEHIHDLKKYKLEKIHSSIFKKVS